MAVLYADSTVSTNESMSALQTVLKHPLLSEYLSLAVSDIALSLASYDDHVFILSFFFFFFLLFL